MMQMKNNITIKFIIKTNKNVIYNLFNWDSWWNFYWNKYLKKPKKITYENSNARIVRIFKI